MKNSIQKIAIKALASIFVILIAFSIVGGGNTECNSFVDFRATTVCHHVFDRNSDYPCREKVCLKCGEIVYGTENHRAVFNEAQEPTCEHVGYKDYVCERCGYSHVEVFGAAKGHNYVNGKCTVCGETKTEQFKTLKPSTYSAAIENTAGDPFFLANENRIEKGDTITYSFSVKTVKTVAAPSANHFFKIIGNNNISGQWRHEKETKGRAWTVASDINTDLDETSNDIGNPTGNNYKFPLKQSSSYKLIVSPQSGSSKYKWKFYRGSSLLDSSSSIDYAPFFGIYWYGFKCRIVLENISISSEKKNYGVYGYNGSRADYSCLVTGEDESSSPDENRFSSEDILTKESTEGIKSVDGFDNNVIRVLPKSDKSKIFVSIPELNSYKTKTRVRVYLNINVVRDEKDLDGWSSATLVNDEGKYVDDAFPYDYWSKVSFETHVQARSNGKKFITIGIENSKGVACLIRNVRVDKNIIPIVNRYGGTKITQVESPRVCEGYLLQAKDGKVVIIDGGDPLDSEAVHKKIIKAGGTVHGWFISHYHDDHVGALYDMLARYSDIVIENIYYDFSAPKELLEKYPDSSNHYVEDLDKRIQSTSIKVGNVITPKKGDLYDFGELKVKVLNNAEFCDSTNMGNDSSVVYKVETPGDSILFLGDLGLYGNELLEDDYFCSEIKNCKTVQMAHHGQSGVSDLLYEKIDEIVVCLYPTPTWLFNCDASLGIGSGNWGTMHTRMLMRQLNARYSYSCRDGWFTIG